MPDFSLVPIDHQPDFGGVSFVPVDHDPFNADGMIEQARTQLESQPQRLATGAGSPDVGAPAVGDGGQFSAGIAMANKAAGIASKVAYGMMTQLATLPQRALEASAADVEHLGENGYTPQSIGPAVETALMMMGGSGTVPAGANELRTGLKLPMYTAARMARAQEMGFRTDMPLYHGSGTEFSSPRAVSTNAAGMESPGVSLALDPEVANEFAVARGSEQTNPQVYKLLHRAERQTSLTLDGSETHGQVVDALRSAFDAGHDSVMIKNYTSLGGIRKQNIIIVRDANQLRSPNAAFDPARKFDPYLLGGIAGLSVVPATRLGQGSDDSGDGALPCCKELQDLTGTPMSDETKAGEAAGVTVAATHGALMQQTKNTKGKSDA